MSSYGNAGSADFAEGGQGYSPVSVAVAVVAGVIAAFVLSWVYAIAGHYSPFIYLNLVITGAFGWVLGKVVCAVLMKKRIDSPCAALLVGGITGLFAVWFSWLTYVWVITGYNFSAFADCLASPALLWELIGRIAESPVWALSSRSGRGGSEPAIFYYAVWFCELAVLVCLPAGLSLSFVKSNRLCARCRDWIKETGDTAAFLLNSDTTTQTVEALNGGDISVLRGLLRRPQEGDEAMEWLEAKGYACPQCQDEDSFVSVSHVALVLNKKSKKLERSEKLLARHVAVDVDTEKKIFEPVASAPAEAEAAPAGNEPQ